MNSQSNYPHKNEELKERITELLTTLEKVKRNSELKQQQADELIIDLKKSNRYKSCSIIDYNYPFSE